MQRGQPLATCQGLLVRIPPAAAIQFDYRFSISPVTFPARFTVERVLFFNDSSVEEKLIRTADVRAVLYLFFLLQNVEQKFYVSSIFLEFLVTYQGLFILMFDL